MVQLHRNQPKFADHGGDLVIIGNGAPNFIAGFREHTGYTGALYTDPSLRSYEALALTRSLRSSVNLRTIGSAVTALRGGFRQRKVQGDVWQQGGVFVVGIDGGIHLAYRAEYAGDMPALNDVLKALDAAQNPATR